MFLWCLTLNACLALCLGALVDGSFDLTVQSIDFFTQAKFFEETHVDGNVVEFFYEAP